MKKNVYTLSTLFLSCLVSVSWAIQHPDTLKKSISSLGKVTKASQSTPIQAGTPVLLIFNNAQEVKSLQYVSTADPEQEELVYFVCNNKVSESLEVSGSDSYNENPISFDSENLFGQVTLSSENTYTINIKDKVAVSYPDTVVFEALSKTYYTGSLISGKFFDAPILLNEGSSEIVIPNQNFYEAGSDPVEIQDWDHITWVSFTAKSSGIASFNVALNQILVYDFDSNNAQLSNPQTLFLEYKSDTRHNIAVTKDQTYLVALNTVKPVEASIYFSNELKEGSNQITLQSTKDQHNFTYTCNQPNGEVLYIQSSNVSMEGYEVRFTGGIREGMELEYEYYDLGAGGYSSIIMEQGQTLDFVVTTSMNEDMAPFPRSINVEAFPVSLVKDLYSNDYIIPGSTYDVPIEISEVSRIFPVSDNHSTWIPELAQINSVTWGRFHSSINGLMNISIEDYIIYVYEDQDGEPTNLQKIAIPTESFSKTDHRFIVEKDKEYRVAFIHQRPKEVSLKESNIADGDDCLKPMAHEKGDINVQKNRMTWYKYTPAEGDVYMIISSDENFEGTVRIYDDCGDNQVKGYTVKKGKAGEYRSLVEVGHPYLISISATANTADNTVITLTGREAQMGESCDNPYQLIMGENTIGNEKRTYWYAHTATKDCHLHIEGPRVAVLSFHKDCDGMVVGGSLIDDVNNKNYYDYRMKEGESVLVLWTPSSDLENNTFLASEEDIPLTSYCDYSAPFTIGEDIVMKNRTGETWYHFTPTESGFVDFIVDNETWNNSAWSSYIKESCNGKPIQTKSQELDRETGSIHYVFPVEAGKEYKYFVFQYETKTKEDITVKTAFVAPQLGQLCTSPIVTSLDASQEITKGVNSEWYSLAIERSGFYTLDALVGTGYANYIALYENSCNSTSFLRANGQYASPSINTQTFYAQAGTTLLINANSTEGFNTEGQMVKVSFLREAVQGDVCSDPIPAQLNTTYYYSKEKEIWYAIDITTKKDLEFLTCNSSSKPTFYTECNGSNVTSTMFSSTMEKDAAGKYVTRMVLKSDQAASVNTIYMKLPVATMNVGITISSTSGVQNTEIKSMMIYPNPNNGQFYISLEDIKENALVSVFDLSGNRVFVQSLTENLTQMDLSYLAKGNYIVVVRNGLNSIKEKMIIK